MIKLQAIGNLGQDATTNQVNGQSVINFSVAHTEKWKDSSGTQRERTTWISCSYWTTSNVAQYLKKGTSVFVEGIPEVKLYTPNGGSPQANLSLRVSTLQLLGGKREDGD